MTVSDLKPTLPIGLTSPTHKSSSGAGKPSTTPNIANAVLGNLHIKPWYPSFYPEDLIGGRKADWLYVCQWCFKYTHEIMKFSAHCKVCPLKAKPPPGVLVYEKDDYSIYEIDGEEHKLYAQNLSLFAKLFLETKSVFFDASTFLYYILALKLPASDSDGMNTDAKHRPQQVTGFFSKEKMSWDNNNLACLLIFPPFQRRGLGQILIGASYHLGRAEGRLGGPEKPLSTLGRKGYLTYWYGEIVRFIVNQPNRKTVSVKEISESTWILAEDVVAALKEMNVLETRKTAAGNVVVNKRKVLDWAERNSVGLEPVVDEEAFVEEEEAASEGAASEIADSEDMEE